MWLTSASKNQSLYTKQGPSAVKVCILSPQHSIVIMLPGEESTVPSTHITELRDYFESLQSIFLNAYKLGIQIYCCSFKENYGRHLRSSQKKNMKLKSKLWPSEKFEGQVSLSLTY